MTMAAISSDAAHHAQCDMLRASPDASGRPCRASVCDVSPRRLPWSSMLHVCGPMAYKTQILAYHYVENQLLIFVME